MMNSKPTTQHEWLHRMVGDWTSTTEASTTPGMEFPESHGTETVRSLGGLWIVGEGRGGMPGGGEATTMVTLGFDTRAERFVGTWIGSMMTHLWVYDGVLDADGQGLTLHALGPDMEGKGNTTRFTDRIEFRSDDHRVLIGHMEDGKGGWNTLMTVHYHRA